MLKSIRLFTDLFLLAKGNGDTIKCWFVCTLNILYYPVHFLFFNNYLKRSLKESKFVLVTVSEITEPCNRWSSFIITKGRLHYRIPKYLWQPTSHCIALAKICIKFKLHLRAVLSITQTCVSVQSLRLLWTSGWKSFWFIASLIYIA